VARIVGRGLMSVRYARFGRSGCESCEMRYLTVRECSDGFRCFWGGGDGCVLELVTFVSEVSGLVTVGMVCVF
jgi:hypothetical protein